MTELRNNIEELKIQKPIIFNIVKKFSKVFRLKRVCLASSYLYKCYWLRFRLQKDSIVAALIPFWGLQPRIFERANRRQATFWVKSRELWFTPNTMWPSAHSPPGLVLSPLPSKVQIIVLQFCEKPHLEEVTLHTRIHLLSENCPQLRY